jgi:preprotein translocase subunit SecG
MRRRFKRRLVVIAIFAVAFLLFLLFLRYLITERTPPQDSSVAISPLVSCSS